MDREISVNLCENTKKMKPFHVFKVDNNYFIVDILESRSFSLPGDIGDVLLSKKKSNQQIELKDLSENHLFWLSKKKFIVPKIEIKDEPFSSPLKIRDLPPVWALFLNITEECNLRCRYCIVEGTYLKKIPKMDYKVIKNAIERFFEESTLDEVEIHFFGGEPLTNPEAIKAAVRIALETAKLRQKKVKFVISTNGVLLNEKWLSFFLKNKFTVLLSIDGPQKIQDYARPFENGNGSYDVIIKNAERLVRAYSSEGLEFAARGIATCKNPDFSSSVEFLSDIGFPAICISPVFSNSEEEFHINNDSLEVFFKADKQFVKKHIESEVAGTPCRSMNLLLFMKKISTHYPQRHFCWAGLQSITVSPSGLYYPCFNWAGLNDNQFKLGDVYNGLDQKKRLKFLNIVRVDNFKKCKKCWARFMCAGGCSACSAKLCHCINGIDDDKLRCRYFRHQLEMAIFASEELRIKDPVNWQTHVGASLSCTIDQFLL